jgi:hypothetical protein
MTEKDIAKANEHAHARAAAMHEVDADIPFAFLEAREALQGAKVQRRSGSGSMPYGLSGPPMFYECDQALRNADRRL